MPSDAQVKRFVSFTVKVGALEKSLLERGININRSKLLALYNAWKNDDKQTGDFIDYVEEEIN